MSGFDFIAIAAIAVGGFFAYKKFSNNGNGADAPPAQTPRQEPASVTQKSASDILEDLEYIDVGTPEERYQRAGELWDTGNQASQDTALAIYMRLTEERVAFTKPYVMLSNIMHINDAKKHSEEILELERRLVELEPDNAEYEKRLQSALFLCGKVRWDQGRHESAFYAYIEGLDRFIEAGNDFSQSSPLTPRIAFRACKMFALNAHEAGDSSLGVRLFDWCDKAGIDVNEEIDISDAETE